MDALTFADAREVLDRAAGEAPQVYKLAFALAPAARIDIPLLRAARLFFIRESSPSLEPAFWWSELVGTRGEVAVTLDAEVARLLRARLRKKPAEERAARIELVHRLHQAASPLVQLEEQIVALTLEGEAASSASVQQALEAALKALLEQAPGAIDLARWAVRALPELTLPLVAAETARWLTFAAAAKLGRVPEGAGRLALREPPAWLLSATARARSGVVPRRSIRLSWRDDRLVAEGGDGPDGDHEVTVPDTALPTLRVAAQGLLARWVPLTKRAEIEVPTGTVALDLTAQDGATYRIEDAVRADAPPSLRVLVIGDPEHNPAAAERFSSALEDRLRGLAGLHPAVLPVVRRLRCGPFGEMFGLETEARLGSLTWMDRSRWRILTSELLRDAPIVVVVSPAPGGDRGWFFDLIGRLKDQWDPLESTCRHASLSIL